MPQNPKLAVRQMSHQPPTPAFPGPIVISRDHIKVLLFLLYTAPAWVLLMLLMLPCVADHFHDEHQARVAPQSIQQLQQHESWLSCARCLAAMNPPGPRALSRLPVLFAVLLVFWPVLLLALFAAVVSGYRCVLTGTAAL